MNESMFKLAPNFSEKEFEKEFGDEFSYNIMEGGYISKDRSTIVIVSRAPYNNTVRLFMPVPNAFTLFHEWGKKLSDKNMLEEVIK